MIKKFFAFLWKWPLPILGALNIVGWLGLWLFSIASSVSGKTQYGVDLNLATTVASPSERMEIQLWTNDVAQLDVLKMFIDEDAIFDDAVLHLMAKGQKPDIKVDYYFLALNRLDRFKEIPLDDLIQIDWISDVTAKIIYCGVTVSEFYDQVDAWFEDDTFETVTIELEREIAYFEQLGAPTND